MEQIVKRMTLMSLLCGFGCGGPAQVDLAGLGQDCAHQGCASGLECVSYSGFAGNELKSCEIRCGTGQSCPQGLQCGSIADGPANICG